MVWQRAIELALAVYGVTSRGRFARDFGLKDQAQRSAVSVASNIAEGFERNGDREFTHFLYVAKASAGELRTQLHIARELSYLDADTFSGLSRQSLSLSRMLTALIQSLRTSPNAGAKFRPTASQADN